MKELKVSLAIRFCFSNTSQYIQLEELKIKAAFQKIEPIYLTLFLSQTEEAKQLTMDQDN